MRETASTLRRWAQAAKRDAIAIYLAARDPRVPWPVKALAALIAAYALSPIDLIPDFIPVLGYLDELILLPAAIWLLVRLIDPAIIAEMREEAALLAERPVSRWGVVLIVAVWIGAAALLWWIFWPRPAH